MLMHKTANILNKLPKSQRPKAKHMLQDIRMAGTNKDAEAAFDAFVETYAVKCEKAVECLKKKDRDPLLAFYDFQAEHWKHLRTSRSNRKHLCDRPARTIRSKGCLSNKTALAAGVQASRRRAEGCTSPWRPQPVAKNRSKV